MKKAIWVLLLSFGFLLLSACGGSESGNDEYSIDLDSSSLSFIYVLGETDPAVQTVSVSFKGDGLLVGYPPSINQPSWLDIDEADPSDTSSPVDIEFSINTYGLDIGSYQTTVRFVTGNVDGSTVKYEDMPVSLQVVNRIGVSSSALDYSYIYAPAADPLDQTIDITGDGLSWTASPSESWIMLDSSSGTAPSTLGIDINTNGLAAGQYSATINIDEASSSHRETVSVSLTVEPHKLFVGDNGAALASFPTARSRLSHSITVSDNAGASISWSASSNQSWLSVTSSGISGDRLVLTADAASLTTDAIHFADVTVTSPEATITNSETIQLGFYVAANDPMATDMIVEGLFLASDPIRPYVYVTNRDTNIDIYHIYTGTLVDTITAGTTLTNMAVNSNGSTLFVADEDSDEVVPVNLETREVSSAWSRNAVNSDVMLEFMRINGHPYLLTSDGDVFDTSDGTVVTDFTPGSWNQFAIAAALDGQSFYSLQTGVSGGGLSLSRYEGYHSDVLDNLRINLAHNLTRSFSNVTDLATNHDGSKVYTAAGGEYEFPTFLFDGTSISAGTVLAGEAYPDAVELGPTEIMYGGVYYGATDVRSYGGDDSTGPTYALTGNLLARQLKVSGDGLVMLSLTEVGSYPYSYQLNFTLVEP